MLTSKGPLLEWGEVKGLSYVKFGSFTACAKGSVTAGPFLMAADLVPGESVLKKEEESLTSLF